MNVMTLPEASRNLPRVIEDTIKNSDETIIVSDSGAVVMIDQRDWEEIQETLRLFNDRRSLKALLEGIELREKGQPVIAKTMSEAFYDLQN
ncbi:MAG: type II toxin-antitoxin system Phd/YefM family antitoxin [Ardenticatenaceae bacterium]